MRWHCHHKVRIIYNKHAKHSQQGNNHPPTSTQLISTTTNQCNASPRKRRNKNVKYLAQILTPIAHFLRTNFKLVGKYSILAKVFHPSKSCINVGQQNAYSYRKTQFQQSKRAICSKTQGYLQQNAVLTPTKCKANSSKTQGKMLENANRNAFFCSLRMYIHLTNKKQTTPI